MERPERPRAVQPFEQLVEFGEQPPGVVRAAVPPRGQGAAAGEGPQRLAAPGRPSGRSCSGWPGRCRWPGSPAALRRCTSGGYQSRVPADHRRHAPARLGHRRVAPVDEDQAVLAGVDEHVLGQHRAVHDARAVREAERDQQPPPHPGDVARVDPAGVRGAHLGEAVEAVEAAERVGAPLGARCRVTVRGRSRPGAGTYGRNRPSPSRGQLPQRDRLAFQQVVVSRVARDLEQPRMPPSSA